MKKKNFLTQIKTLFLFIIIIFIKKIKLIKILLKYIQTNNLIHFRVYPILIFFKGVFYIILFNKLIKINLE